MASFMPLLTGDVASWAGLPKVEFATLVDAFGDPAEIADASLGVEPAQQAVFTRTGGFTAFLRAGVVVMVEAIVLPTIEVLEQLPEPCATLPEEMYVENSYAHELLFCELGLLLTVAEQLLGERTKEIVRSRGIRTLGSPEDLGTDLYMSRDNEVNW